ncbi:hypothetical protein Bca4012_098301 [Brassica carinata]
MLGSLMKAQLRRELNLMAFVCLLLGGFMVLGYRVRVLSRQGDRLLKLRSLISSPKVLFSRLDARLKTNLVFVIGYVCHPLFGFVLPFLWDLGSLPMGFRLPSYGISC